MNDLCTSPVPVWPYVVVGAIVKSICGAIGFWYVNSTGSELPNMGVPVAILATGVGIAWYSYSVNRPMQQSELLRFATGAVVVDIVLSLLMTVGPILWIGETLSLRNIDIVLGGDGTNVAPLDLAPLGGLMLFMSLMVFGLSYFFARQMTKRLPRGSSQKQASGVGGPRGLG